MSETEQIVTIQDRRSMIDLFQQIDAAGGWPIGKSWITMRHDDNRTCYFSETERRDGWNTSLYHADDYYLWKLSEKGLAEILKRVALAINDRFSMARIISQIGKDSIQSERKFGLHHP